MTPEELRSLGSQLGPRWKATLAPLVPCNPASLKKWARGDRPVPIAVQDRIRQTVREQVAARGIDDACVIVGRHVMKLGQTFGRWTLLELPSPNQDEPVSKQRVLCRCECGFSKHLNVNLLLVGKTRQCVNCCNASRGTHRCSRVGGRRPRLYRIWQGMNRRCNPENKATEALYHGRGIAVCPQWRSDFAAFRDWSLANGYRDDLTLDRWPDKDGDYEPGNCRWASYQDQGRNKRTNRLLTAFGETKPITEWSDDPRCLATLACLYLRTYAGWEDEKAITTPSRQAKCNAAA